MIAATSALFIRLGKPGPPKPKARLDRDKLVPKVSSSNPRLAGSWSAAARRRWRAGARQPSRSRRTVARTGVRAWRPQHASAGVTRHRSIHDISQHARLAHEGDVAGHRPIVAELLCKCRSGDSSQDRTPEEAPALRLQAAQYAAPPSRRLKRCEACRARENRHREPFPGGSSCDVSCRLIQLRPRPPRPGAPRSGTPGRPSRANRAPSRPDLDSVPVGPRDRLVLDVASGRPRAR